MKRVEYLPGAPDQPELIVLKLSSEEHKKLHAQGKKFVNDQKLFGNDVEVKTVKLHTETHDEECTEWMVAMFHYPSCLCPTICVPAKDPAAKS